MTTPLYSMENKMTLALKPNTTKTLGARSDGPGM